MTRGWMVVALLAAGCGAPSGNDPGRYGTVRVALDGIGAAASGAIGEAIVGMSAVGPTIAPAAVADATLVLVGGADEGLCPDFCGVTYDLQARRAVLGRSCAAQPPDVQRRLATHALGHLLGMGHVDGDAVMRGLNGRNAVLPAADAGSQPWYECGGTAMGSTSTPTALDVAEYRRSHP